MEDDDHAGADAPASLLPYDLWTEAAMRGVVIRALAEAAANGLPGDHHFYITFRTDRPDVVIPQRLRQDYPTEMTIVLQHQFWDLSVDERAGHFSVGLSFGGVPTTLVIPFEAVVAFADPAVQFGLRLTPPEPAAEPAEAPDAAAAAEEAAEEPPSPAPQVVSLDAFRRRSSKDTP